MAVQPYSIGDLAREFGVTTRTIRFYEDHGLLSPRRQGQRRIYRERDRVRLRLILRGKRLGFSLAEIAETLELYDGPRGEARQLRFLMDKIQSRRAELEAKRQDLEVTMKDLDRLFQDCQGRLVEIGALPAKAASADPGASGGSSRT